MRTAFITAAFAAAAMAVPLNEKRVYDYVTDTDVVMVTDVVTVTASGPPPAYTSTYAPAPPAPSSYHHHHHHHHHSSQAPPPPPSSTEQPTTTSAPPPPPSSTYVPPTTSYAPPPSSSAAPPPPASSSSAPSSGGNYPLQPYGGATGSEDYKSAVLNHHNIHRANNSAPPLQWDDSLMAAAKEVAASCIWGHNTQAGGGGYGQNIAAGIQDSTVASSITNMFYNGEIEAYSACYGEANPDNCNFESCGHYTQVVWKSTTHVACWTYDCSATGMTNIEGNIPPYFTVCNYGPPGNYAGEYGDNVMRPLGRPTVSVP